MPYLGAGAGTSKEHAGALAGERTGGTRITKVGESLDQRLDETLLAETGLGHGRKSDDKERLDLHVEGRKRQNRPSGWMY